MQRGSLEGGDEENESDLETSVRCVLELLTGQSMDMFICSGTALKVEDIHKSNLYCDTT